MRSNLALALTLVALALACKEQPPPAPEVALTTDLPASSVEQMLRAARAQGAPFGERLALKGDPDGGYGEVPRFDRTAGTSTADLRWDLEPYAALDKAARGELLPAPQSASDVPPLWRDPGGSWVAIGGRAEVLLVATSGLGDHPAPSRFKQLTEPWLLGKVAMTAPLRGAALAHFAALYAAYGEEKMRLWLNDLRANRVLLLDTDAEVRDAVVQGRAIAGLLGSDMAAAAAASAAHVTVIYPNQSSIGTFVWPTALYVRKDAARPEQAAKLAEALGSRSSEQLLVAREPGFLPLRPGIATPPGVRSASNLVVISVGPARIAGEIEQRRDELAEWVHAVRADALEAAAAADAGSADAGSLGGPQPTDTAPDAGKD